MDIEQVVAYPFQLKEVVLERIVCQKPANFSEQLKLNIQAKTVARLISANSAYGYLRVRITAEDDKQFKIEVSIRGECVTATVDDKLPKKSQLKEFCELQSLPLLLPWVRQIIADLSVKMGLPPLMLPLISVMDTFNVLKEKKSERN